MQLLALIQLRTDYPKFGYELLNLVVGCTCSEVKSGLVDCSHNVSPHPIFIGCRSLIMNGPFSDGWTAIFEEK